MVAKVCNVNIENVFIYKGNKYKICDSVDRYRVNNIPEENNAQMDTVLVVEDKDMIWFLDEEMNKIKSKFIEKLD
jgi:hypothetical protein